MNLNAKPRANGIYWFLVSNGQLASSRLQGLLINDVLSERGFQSQILYAPFTSHTSVDIEIPLDLTQIGIARGDILVIQKLDGPNTLRVVEMAAELGAHTVYVECDLRRTSTVKYDCDVIVCPSVALAQQVVLTSPSSSVRVIQDPYERSARPVPRASSDRVRVVWIGSRQHWDTVSIIREILSEPQFDLFELYTISDHPASDRKWALDSAFAEWSGADICVVPTGSSEEALVKSSNRVVQSMALGVPVIAGDIPAYREVIESGVNGWICGSSDEYRTAFSDLSSAERRADMARLGFEFATLQFDVTRSVDAWEELFRDISGDGGLASYRADAESVARSKRMADVVRGASIMGAVRRQGSARQATRLASRWIMSCPGIWSGLMVAVVVKWAKALRRRIDLATRSAPGPHL